MVSTYFQFLLQQPRTEDRYILTEMACETNDDHHHNPHLPEEVIIVHILTRLPVKFLLGFKSVSKRWNSIISSPYLARLHLKQTAFPKNQHLLINHNTCFLSFDYASYGGGADWDCSPFDDEGDRGNTPDNKQGLARIIMSSFHAEHPRIFMVGSCHGLVCLNTRSQFLYLWNPTTLVHRQIPYPQPSNTYDVVWGFGYVSLTDDYRVVRICQNRDNSEKHIQVFSLMCNSWTSSQELELDGYGDCPRLIGSGLWVNNVTYWTMSSKVHNLDFGELRWCVIGFDLVANKLKKIPLPQWKSDGFEYSPLMYVMGGCFCACWSTHEKVVEIGVLKEDEGLCSWAKLFHLNHDYLFHSISRYHPPSMPGITNEGRLTLHASKGILELIDPRKDPPEDVHRLRVPYTRNVVNYVESLLSPFGTNLEK